MLGDLFGAAATHRPARSDALAEAVVALHPDEMTPREAMDALYRLKQIGGREGR